MKAKNVVKPASLPVRSKIRLSQWERQKYGVTITLREQQTGRLESNVIREISKVAVRSMCDLIDGRDEDWRILCISTPETIYRDLQGTRKNEWADKRDLAEYLFLQSVDRHDLLDPSLEIRGNGR